MELLSLIRDDLQRSRALTARFPRDLFWRAAARDSTAWMNSPNSRFIFRCASRNQRIGLTCRNQVAQPEYATVGRLVLYGAKVRRSSPQRAGNLVIQIEVHVRGAS